MINGGGWSRPATEITIRGAYDNGTTWTSSALPAASDVLYAVNRTNGGAYDFTTSNNDPTYGSLGSGEVFAFHPGGANVALGDGSVRLINQKRRHPGVCRSGHPLRRRRNASRRLSVVCG